MSEMENIAEFYYEKLKVTTNAGLDLAHFFTEVIGKDAGRSEIIMINRLIKLFGRFTVYFSIMDLSKSERLEGNLYPLLYTICKNRFERIYNGEISPALQPLNKEISNLQKQIEKMRGKKIKFPKSEGLE